MYYLLHDQDLGWGDFGVALALLIVFTLLFLALQWFFED